MLHGSPLFAFVTVKRLSEQSTTPVWPLIAPPEGQSPVVVSCDQNGSFVSNRRFRLVLSCSLKSIVCGPVPSLNSITDFFGFLPSMSHSTPPGPSVAVIFTSIAILHAFSIQAAPVVQENAVAKIHRCKLLRHRFGI